MDKGRSWMKVSNCLKDHKVLDPDNFCLFPYEIAYALIWKKNIKVLWKNTRENKQIPKIEREVFFSNSLGK